jgi:hypothetical protein
LDQCGHSPSLHLPSRLLRRPSRQMDKPPLSEYLLYTGYLLHGGRLGLTTTLPETPPANHHRSPSLFPSAPNPSNVTTQSPPTTCTPTYPAPFQAHSFSSAAG